MIRSLCTAALLTCAIASGQSFVSPTTAESPADPASVHSSAAVAKNSRFDSVSIKPAFSPGQQTNVIYAYPNGRVFCTHCTLQFLATQAFDLHDWQITGNQDWTSFATAIRYDIEATSPESAVSSETDTSGKTLLSPQQRQMLRFLLADRFRLASHRETRSDTVYLLQKGDQPLKLVPPLHPSESHWAGATAGGPIGSTPGISGKNITMPEFAARISTALKHPVLDQTRLPGRFDFQSSPEGQPSNTDPTLALPTAIRGLGLKLTPTKGPVETLIIDHAEPPTQN